MLSSSTTAVSFLTTIGNSLQAVSITTWVLIVCVFLFVVVFALAGLAGSETSATRVEPAAPRLPGPSGLASTRLLLGMLKGAPRKIYQASRAHGALFGIGEGSGTFCFLLNRTHLEEAFVTKAESFTDRGGIIHTLMSFIPARGTINNNGSAWYEARDFVTQTIKNADFGRTNIANSVLESIPSLKKALDRRIDKAFDPKFVFQCFATDVIHRIAFGVEIDYDDAAVQRFITSLNDVVSQTINPSLSLLAIPSISNGCLYAGFRAKLRSSASYVKSLGTAALHRRNPETLVSRYADYIEGIRRMGKSTASEPDDGWRLVYDFFFAASDTLHEVLLWAALFLATRADVQEKMSTEITQASNGSDSIISYEDRARVPYVTGTMLEVLRMRPVAPMGVPRFASEDGCVGGFAVPKGAQFHPNLWAMHHDPEVWRQPGEFDPSRFLDDRGLLNEQMANLVIPFSIGPRSCPGEQIARITIFQALITMVTNYRITLPRGAKPNMDDKVHSFTMVPDRFKVILSGH